MQREYYSTCDPSQKLIRSKYLLRRGVANGLHTKQDVKKVIEVMNEF